MALLLSMVRRLSRRHLSRRDGGVTQGTHMEVVMKKWMSGIRGTLLMILLWIVGWGLGFGGLIEAFIDTSGEILDIWFTAMALPGFIGGVVFSALLAIAERGRSFDQVSLVRFASWGAVTGLVIGGIAMARGIELTLTTGKIFVITTALGIVAAIGSAVFFRLLARWRLPPSQTNAHNYGI